MSLTQDANTIVQGDNDDVAVAGEHTSINHVPAALHVRASVDVHHDRFGSCVSDICGGGEMKR